MTEYDGCDVGVCESAGVGEVGWLCVDDCDLVFGWYYAGETWMLVGVEGGADDASSGCVDGDGSEVGAECVGVSV